MDKDLIQLLRESIESVANAFRARPLRYLTEADLQAAIYTELANRVDPTGAPAEGAIDTRLGRVHCTWPQVRKFDVAVADPAVTEWAIATSPPVRIGLLVRLLQAGGAGGSIGQDLDKLRQGAVSRRPADFTGIAIVFCHPDVSWKSTLGLHRFEDPVFPRNGCELQVVDPTGWRGALI